MTLTAAIGRRNNGGLYMAKWCFTCRDNGGKFQNLTVTASNKTKKIKKGLQRASKKAAGEIAFNWNCKLIKA